MMYNVVQVYRLLCYPIFITPLLNDDLKIAVLSYLVNVSRICQINGGSLEIMSLVILRHTLELKVLC